jgi:hypothetical protein
MKKLVIPVVILLFSFASPADCLDEVGYPRKSTIHSKSRHYDVPSVYPTLQSAVDAAMKEGGQEVIIYVAAGEYRESVTIHGLKNLRLVGRNARILPPGDFRFPDPPAGVNMPAASVKLVGCENFTVEGFTFIGDDFVTGTGRSYPMGSAIHAYNSSGRIFNNLIFNYFDGISYQVDNLRWMTGEIRDNYIHNCLWSGIFATGSHNLKIERNKITFTIPKSLSLSVGIWADGGMGTISGNRITSYRSVVHTAQRRSPSMPSLWPSHFDFTLRVNYKVFENTYEQSAACAYLGSLQTEDETRTAFVRLLLPIHNYFINVIQTKSTSIGSEMVMISPGLVP